jgi:hypothetical protein
MVDISAKVIPQFSKKNMYELPRKGTTIKVFAKKSRNPARYEISEKGAKLYDFGMEGGKFTSRDKRN